MGIKDTLNFLFNKKEIISSAIIEIDEYYDLDKYSVNTKKIIILQRNSTVDSITYSKSIQEVNKNVNEFKKFINNTETLIEEKNRLKTESLVKTKADAINEIDNYALIFNYNIEERNQIFELRNSIVGKIKNSECESVIKTLVNQYIENIKKINLIVQERKAKLEEEEKKKRLEEEARNKVEEIKKKNFERTRPAILRVKSGREYWGSAEKFDKFHLLIDSCERTYDLIEKKHINNCNVSKILDRFLKFDIDNPYEIYSPIDEFSPLECLDLFVVLYHCDNLEINNYSTYIVIFNKLMDLQFNCDFDIELLELFIFYNKLLRNWQIIYNVCKKNQNM